MNLVDLQKSWNTFGQTDPFWAILTTDDKKGGRWQTEDFFETGRKEIADVLRYAASLPVPQPYRKALDFGCGAGRLTQALASHFEEVVGVDIAPSMIELADKHNKFQEKCHYLVNAADDLSLFPSDSFDLIYSNIVLQHMQPQYAKKYIQEFYRVLAPQGLLIFQIPTEPSNELPVRQRIIRKIPKGLMKIVRTIRKRAVMEMHGINREDVIDLLKKQGSEIMDIQLDQSARGWISYRYCVTKK